MQKQGKMFTLRYKCKRKRKFQRYNRALQYFYHGDVYPVMVVLILILLRLLLKRRQLRRLPKRKAVKRKLWVREIFQKRYQQGDFHNLVKELRLGDREFYFR